MDTPTINYETLFDYVKDYVVLVLLNYFERLSKAGRANLELVIIGFAVEAVFYVAAQLGTVFNPHSLGVVNFNCDFVVFANYDIYQKILLVGEPLICQIDYLLSVNHIVCLIL